LIPRSPPIPIKAKKNAPDPFGLEQIFVVKKNPVAEKSMSFEKISSKSKVLTITKHF
jgi:hypothetical protein